jgi:protein-S-isoprenylcysteine O-methyltransferase Ste14
MAGLNFDPIGKNPIPVPLWVLSKFMMLCCWLFFIVKFKQPEFILYESPFTDSLGLIIGIAGCLIGAASLLQLGEAASIGLPRIRTKLRTRGIYGWTRNPVYLGAFAMCVGSCVYAIDPVNFVLCTLTIVMHHRIIKSEERFLAKTFGESWLEYSHRVPRYLGRIGRKRVDRH